MKTICLNSGLVLGLFVSILATELDTDEQRDAYYAPMLDNMELVVPSYNLMGGDFEDALFNIENYNASINVETLAGNGIENTPEAMTIYVNQCADACTKNESCFSFGISVTTNTNECRLLMNSSLYNLWGFFWYLDAPGNGVMMQMYYKENFTCPVESSFFGYSDGGEAELYYSNFGCNDFLESGDYCNDASQVIRDLQYDNYGCAVNSSCEFLDGDAQCFTQEEIEDHLNKKTQEEQDAVKFRQEFKATFGAMLEAPVPESYLKPYDGLVSIDQYGLTENVLALENASAFETIDGFIEACSAACNGYSQEGSEATCIGISVIFVPDSTKNECRLLKSDVVYGFSSLGCKIEEPCRSGNGKMSVVFIKDSIECPSDHYYGFELIPPEEGDEYYQQNGLFRLGCNPYFEDGSYCSEIYIWKPTISLTPGSSNGCKPGSVCGTVGDEPEVYCQPANPEGTTTTTTPPQDGLKPTLQALD